MNYFMLVYSFSHKLFENYFVNYFVISAIFLRLNATSQELIQQYVHWNEDIGEWQLKCVAYTGNNMSKHQQHNDASVHQRQVSVPSLQLSWNTALPLLW